MDAKEPTKAPDLVGALSTSGSTQPVAGATQDGTKLPAAPEQKLILKTPGSVAVPGTDLSIVVESKTIGRGVSEFKVALKGSWEGRTLRGAIRAIEREYRSIKHNTTRAAVQAAADARRKAETPGVSK